MGWCESGCGIRDVRWFVIGKEMGSFIRFKKAKIENVFQSVGDNCSEDTFTSAFKSLYPDDWQKIQDLWFYEEQCTPPGKRHPMPDPDTYMKEMYRNHKSR